ncbi:MAG: hypothetical protein ACYC3X_21460 [Pirellulaceae bacterium]
MIHSPRHFSVPNIFHMISPKKSSDHVEATRTEPVVGMDAHIHLSQLLEHLVQRQSVAIEEDTNIFIAAVFLLRLNQRRRHRPRRAIRPNAHL